MSSREWAGVVFGFSMVFVPGVSLAAQSTQESETGPTLKAGATLDLEESLRLQRQAASTWRLPSPPDGQDENASKGRNNAQNETAIAIDPLDENHAVAVSNDYHSGNVLTGFYTTFDRGQTWTNGDLPLEPGFSFSGDPSVVFTPAGIPVIVCLQYFGPGGSGIYAYHSLDGGLNWQPGVRVDLNGANDKVQTACDLSGGPFHGQICSSWDRFGTSQGDTVFVATSSDGGATWGTSKRIDDLNNHANISPDVAYGANSELWVMWADRGTEDIYVDRSIDGGATFGTDILVRSFNQVPSPIPGSSFRMFDIFTIAADWTTGPYAGNVYVAFHTWKGGAGQNANIRCAVSSDHGVTWTDKLIHSDGADGNDQVMPHAAVDSKGNLNIGFYDRRLDPSNFLLWTWVARSSDGGQTFVDYRISNQGWNHNTTEFPSFIGDYTGLDASDHAVWPCWTDGRNGTQNVMVDAATLDFFSDVDTVSAATGGTVNFTINVGPNHATDGYFMLGSLSSTTGITFGNGVHLPLDFDALFLLTIKFANSPAFPGSFGALDATGSAAAAMVTGPLDPSAVGLDLYFATLVLDSGPAFATNATKVTIDL